MHAEIISVGTELLLGHTVNTDAALVARELAAAGVDLLFSSVFGDNPERLRAALDQALERSDLVVTTGGLGPTDDDLTRETVARAAGLRLTLHEESLRRLEHFFQGRPVDDLQRRQAMLPEGCTVFVNELGTAPGCAVVTAAGRTIIMLPGPPSELERMFRTGVAPYLEARSGGVIHSCMVRTFGMGEGRVAALLAGLTDQANPTAATYATENETFVRVTAKAADRAEAAALCRPVVDAIRERLGDVVYGVDVPNLEHVVVAELIARRMCLTTAESCTGGLLAKRLTDVPGASAVFRTGVITYANEAKMRLLGVPEAILAEHGAVSEATAKAMAEGARRLLGGPGEGFGVGITGVAGPGGGTLEKPVGLVYIALSDGQETWTRVMSPPPGGAGRDRAWLRLHASSHALDLVRRRLLGLPMQRVRPNPAPDYAPGTETRATSRG